MIELPAGRMSGNALRAVVLASRGGLTQKLVAKVLRHQVGIDRLDQFPAESCSYLPQSVVPLRARTKQDRPSDTLEPFHPVQPLTSQRLTAAYRSGDVTPEGVTERVIEAATTLAERLPSMTPFTSLLEESALESARASAERYRAGNPIGPLDGVVIPIKEEVFLTGVPSRNGTAWIPMTPSREDAVAVARLRAAGAILVGQTMQTEYGMNPLGVNPHRIMPRNPFDGDRLAGGSSTGAAVAVAMGLCPVALGTDGGGSIRVPAAYCGLFGLKPTYGRIPLTGHANTAGGTMIHVGPLATCTADLATFVETCAGPDLGDEASLAQPALEQGQLTAALRRGVRGLRIGIDEALWEHCDERVAAPARRALAALVEEGAKVVHLQTRLFAHATAIGYLTIGLEAASALREVRKTHSSELGLDLQLVLQVLNAFRGEDYLVAQRLRGELRREAKGLLADCDVIALPSTANLAPRINDDEARTGMVDPDALDATSRYVYVANLTGLPAASAPLGVTDGSPVGLQIIGDAWDEACVLQVLGHLERIGLAQVSRPPGYIDVVRD